MEDISMLDMKSEGLYQSLKMFCQCSQCSNVDAIFDIAEMVETILIANILFQTELSPYLCFW